MRLHLRGGAVEDGDGIHRVGDDQRVNAGLWYLAGGMGKPPTGKGLREWKRKDLERKEREKVAREAKKAEMLAKVKGVGDAVGNVGGKAKGGFSRLFAGFKKKKVVQPAPTPVPVAAPVPEPAAGDGAGAGPLPVAGEGEAGHGEKHAEPGHTTTATGVTEVTETTRTEGTTESAASG